MSRSINQTEAEIKLKNFYSKAQLDLQLKLTETDKNDINKLECCAEYVSDITTYMCKRQNKVAAQYGYMMKQTEITEDMRANVVDWMCSVSERLNLKQETLFLATNMLDRYLSLEVISQSRLQLAALSSLIIASKYEEIYPPNIRDFIRIATRPPFKIEVQQCENSILTALKYDISISSILRFVERFVKLSGSSEYVFNLALYFAELQLLDYNMLKYMPSLIGAACVYIASIDVKGEPLIWNDEIRKESGHEIEEVKNCAKALSESLKRYNNVGMQSTKRKFSNKKFMEVGKVRIDTLVL